MMTGSIEGYYSVPPEERRGPLRGIVAELKRIAPSQPLEAAGILRQIVQPDLDCSTALTLARIQKGLNPSGVEPAKLAILGSFTTEQLSALIQLFLFALGIEVEIYESDYDVYHQEIADSTSGLHAFGPEIVFLATNRRSIGHQPGFDDSRARVRELVEAEVNRWAGLWHTAHHRLQCQIIQNNFDLPPWRILNNIETRHHAGLARFISQVNRELEDCAPPFVTIHDVDYLSASAGRWEWGDERFYFHAKLPCAPEYLVPYAHSVASIIGAQKGKSRKALVLDLDNTLWGGVIGDDGIDGIRCGHGHPEGEAFLAFQQYADGLRRRGVILAVCSKNDENVAREVFEKHPEMVLRSADISCFIANWDDKATNLRRIAKRLDIGLDALVFVDDNPAERALVRQRLPEVAVPELPRDPAGYIRALEQHGYFQTVSLGAEDLQRTEMYRANGLRQEAQSAVGNIDEFLASLEMSAKVEAVSNVNVERVAQLIARSNQFNLTTRRYSASDVLAMACREDWVTCAISLKDRFGDNGLISVLLAKIAGSDMIIDTWLMSCRVLKRGVEHFLLNNICEAARKRNVDSILGEYIPTRKNALVRDHYSNLGFQIDSSNGDGHTWWRLSLDKALPVPTFIFREPSHD